VQDPAVGTGGFLINADRYVKSQTDDYHDLPPAKQKFQHREAFYDVELVPDVQRLALMNAMLHDIEGDILLGDTLGPTGAQLPKQTSRSRGRRRHVEARTEAPAAR
jgi:type I restriction enzyme M protein